MVMTGWFAVPIKLMSYFAVFFAALRLCVSMGGKGPSHAKTPGRRAKSRHRLEYFPLCRLTSKSCKVKLLWKADPQGKITDLYAASYSVFNSDGSGRGFPGSLQFK